MEIIINIIRNMGPEAGNTVTTIMVGTAFMAFLKYLFTAVGYYKVFGKAGEAGWKAFIPVYGDYHKYRIAWDGKFYFLFLAMYLGNFLLSRVDNSFAGTIGMVMSIVSLVILVKQEIKMAKAFGKGTGFGLLQVLFPFITAPILGFGKAEYVRK